MKNKKKFLFVVKQTEPNTARKHKDDETVCEFTGWPETVEKLRDINRGLAYVKFEPIYGAG